MGGLEPVSMSDKPQSDREITYRVGWKKGKIHVHDASAKESQAAVTPSAAVIPAPPQAPVEAGGKMVSLIWKKAPYPVQSIAIGWIMILPVAVFAVIVWLVARMAEVR